MRFTAYLINPLWANRGIRLDIGTYEEITEIGKLRNVFKSKIFFNFGLPKIKGLQNYVIH